MYDTILLTGIWFIVISSIINDYCQFQKHFKKGNDFGIYYSALIFRAVMTVLAVIYIISK